MKNDDDLDAMRSSICRMLDENKKYVILDLIYQILLKSREEK